MFQRILSTSSSQAATAARVMLGLVIFPHGAQKLLGWFGGYGYSGTMDFFTGTVGLPSWLALLVIITEFFGSLSLLAGFAGRFWAAATIVLMGGIVFTSHLGNGFFMNWSGGAPGEGFEYHLLAIGLALVVLLEGSGKWSVDSLRQAPGA
jgi:putative oxidoreductase